MCRQMQWLAAYVNSAGGLVKTVDSIVRSFHLLRVFNAQRFGGWAPMRVHVSVFDTALSCVHCGLSVPGGLVRWRRSSGFPTRRSSGDTCEERSLQVAAGVVICAVRPPV